MGLLKFWPKVHSPKEVELPVVFSYVLNSDSSVNNISTSYFLTCVCVCFTGNIRLSVVNL